MLLSEDVDGGTPSVSCSSKDEVQAHKVQNIYTESNYKQEANEDRPLIVSMKV